MWNLIIISYGRIFLDANSNSKAAILPSSSLHWIETCQSILTPNVVPVLELRVSESNLCKAHKPGNNRQNYLLSLVGKPQWAQNLMFPTTLGWLPARGDMSGKHDFKPRVYSSSIFYWLWIKAPQWKAQWHTNFSQMCDILKIVILWQNSNGHRNSPQLPSNWHNRFLLLF